MGVLNVTPDSFSDGGRFLDFQAAVTRAAAMAEEGAAIIDIGGESTRPGASPVSVQQELDRVVPLVEAIVGRLPVTVSVDTSKPEVMAAAVRAGAGMINDVRALQAPGALDVLARSDAAVCLMHMRGTPATMQEKPCYDDVVRDVRDFLRQRIQACETAGLGRRRICIDPGFGFGKLLPHNLNLLKHLDALRCLDAPILVGLSRKSSIGAVTGAPVHDRLPGSIAAAVIAAWQGASIVRAHDVKATVQALAVCSAVLEAG